METQLINGRLGMHFSMINQGIRVDLWDIVAPNHILHGRSVKRQITTPKKRGNWGKGKVIWFLVDLESPEEPPEFSTVQEFITHYNLPPLKLR